MEDFIQIKEENVLRFGVKDKDGKDTGLVIKFDLQDIDLPLRINQMEAMHKKNQNILKQQVAALKKQEEKSGKFMLSWKKEQCIKLLKELYSKDMQALDLLIGKGMTQKILNALDRKPYYDMFDDILNSLAPILDKVINEADLMFDKLTDNIKKKYGVTDDELNKQFENVI